MITKRPPVPSGLPDSILEGLLSLLLGATLLLILLQIVLRTAFSGGIAWADPLVRHLVVWTGFFGAILAAGKGRHITIDLLAQVLPPGLRSLAGRLNNLFAAVVCGFLAHAAFLFVRDEMTLGGDTRGLGGIPAKVLILIYPLAFVLLSLRFLTRTLAASASAGTATSGPDKSPRG